jgi:hypothetical protein
VGEVLGVISQYQLDMEEGGKEPSTYAIDIRTMCESLSTAVGKPAGKEYLQQQVNQLACAHAAQWLCSQAIALVQDSHPDRSSSNRLPMQDLCALASSLPGLGAAMGGQARVIPLAEAIVEHAAARIRRGDTPPIVQSWKDLLYGLTKAGLVANMEGTASQQAVQQHSTHLQQLLDQGAQHLPALLSAQGAAEQNVSLTLLAYAYAGYTGDLGPVTQALASNLEGCLLGPKPQECSNILWALGKLCELRLQEGQQVDLQPTVHTQQLFIYLVSELHRQLGGIKPQDVSNAVYGCALAGHVEGVPQLLDSVCQQPQVMARAGPQEWSNTIWAAAKLGCVEQGSVLLERLAGQTQVMAKAKPQEWSNTLWAAASMYEAAARQDNQEGRAQQLQHSGQVIMGAFLKQRQVFDNATPQVWSNTIWAAAKLGYVEQGSVLLERLATPQQAMARWNPQDWSNNVWAAATLYQTAVDASNSAAITEKLQRGGHLLLQACASSPTATQGAKPQEWSNTLWAAAVLRWYHERFLSQGAEALAAMPPAHLKPQDVSNSLYACAVCAHWDDNVQQLMCRVEEYDLAAFNAQDLANTLYAWAVLSCVVATSGASQQHQGAWSSAAPALFKEASRRGVSVLVEKDLSQLYAAHMCAEHLGTPGLPAGAVLEATRAVGWSDGDITISARQREVASALQQLRYTTQLEMKSPDGVMSVDVGVTALPDGSPCSIAVEYDGPSHFMTDNSSSNSPTSNRAAPVDRLDGPTRLRNVFLQARFPDGVVCIPCKEWAAASKARQQEEYLRAAMAAVLKAKVGLRSSLACDTVHVWLNCRGPSCPDLHEHFNSLPPKLS